MYCTAADEFLRDARRLEAEPDDANCRQYEEQTPRLEGNPQKVCKDFPAAIRIGDEAAKARRPHREEEKPRAGFADIPLGKPRELQGQACPKRCLGDIEHRNRRDQSRHGKPDDKHRPARSPRSIRKS